MAAAVSSSRAVDIHADFFALGGHSLIGAQLVHQLRLELNRQTPLRALFEAPTIARLAEWIGRESLAQPADSIPVLQADSGARYLPFPLTEMQQAYWVGRSAELPMGGVSIHSYTELEGEHLDLDAFASAWRVLIQRHDMLRAIVTADRRQRILEETPAYEIAVADLRALDSDSVRTALERTRAEMSHQVLPLERWPAFDIRASHLPGDALRLHISIDTFSSMAGARSCSWMNCSRCTTARVWICPPSPSPSATTCSPKPGCASPRPIAAR